MKKIRIKIKIKMGKHSHSHSHKSKDDSKKRKKDTYEKKRHKKSKDSQSDREEEAFEWAEKSAPSNENSQTMEEESLDSSLKENESSGNAILPNNDLLNHSSNINVNMYPAEPTKEEASNESFNVRNDSFSAITPDIFDTLISKSIKSKKELRMEKNKKTQEETDKRRLELELNPYFKNGGNGEPPESNDSQEKKLKYKIGDSGSKWRMMKLRRVYEIAEEEGKSVEEVAMQRYGSLEDFNEAVHEREVLDQMKSSKSSDRSQHRHSSSYSSNVRTGGGMFKKPKERESERGDDRHHHHHDHSSSHDHEHSENSKTTQSEKVQENTSVNSAPTTTTNKIPLLSIPIMTTTSQIANNGNSENPVFTKNQLNKLNAKIMKARLMNLPNLKELEEQYNIELERFENAENNKTVVIPHFDSSGKYQDIGKDIPKTLPGNQRKPKQEKIETHDKDGNRIRYSKDDDKYSIQDLMMQEKMSKPSDFDRNMAMRISRDDVFSSDLDYLDENATKLTRKQEASEQKKRAIAVNDYKRYQEALDKCYYCYNQEKTPSVPVVSLGNKVYLALPNVVEMVPGHCLIIPMNHFSTTLECEDDVWDEIKNFMKCLIKMFAEENRSVVFMETVVNLRKQRHTVIECIPMSHDDYDDSPAYFKEAIYRESEEWSQHRKIIDTSKNPGGFRRSMVKNLPYFHVWFDPYKGYGHVIENEEFPTWFGKEVIAGIMDLPPNLWRRPKAIPTKENRRRIEEFNKKWEKYDWTKML